MEAVPVVVEGLDDFRPTFYVTRVHRASDSPPSGRGPGRLRVDRFSRLNCGDDLAAALSHAAEVIVGEDLAAVVVTNLSGQVLFLATVEQSGRIAATIPALAYEAAGVSRDAPRRSDVDLLKRAAAAIRGHREGDILAQGGNTGTFGVSTDANWLEANAEKIAAGSVV